MRRRRGETSLYEMLSEPQAPIEERKEGTSPAEPLSDSRDPRGFLRGSRLREFTDSGVQDPSSSRESAEDAAGVAPASHSDLASPEGPRVWLEGVVGVRRILLIIIGIGVLSGFVLSYQVGWQRSKEWHLRMGALESGNPPPWAPEIDPQPGKAAIRNIQGQGEATGGMEGTVGASGEGAMPGGAVEEGRTHGEEGAAADVPADETVFLVVVASGKLGVEAADRLIRHLDTYNLGSPAHLRRSGRGGGQLMIYLGPFPTRDAAKAVLGRVRRLPEYRRTRFSDAYVYSLRAPELQDASDGARP